MCPSVPVKANARLCSAPSGGSALPRDVLLLLREAFPGSGTTGRGATCSRQLTIADAHPHVPEATDAPVCWWARGGPGTRESPGMEEEALSLPH